MTSYLMGWLHLLWDVGTLTDPAKLFYRTYGVCEKVGNAKMQEQRKVRYMPTLLLKGYVTQGFYSNRSPSSYFVHPIGYANGDCCRCVFCTAKFCIISFPGQVDGIGGLVGHEPSPNQKVYFTTLLENKVCSMDPYEKQNEYSGIHPTTFKMGELLCQ